MFVLQAWVLNLRPRRLRVLCSILALHMNARFWTETSDWPGAVGVTLIVLTIFLAFGCHSHVYHKCSFLLLIAQHYFLLASQQLLVCLELTRGVWGHLVCMWHQCSCTLCQALGCASQCMLSQLASYMLLLCGGFVLGTCLYGSDV